MTAILTQEEVEANAVTLEIIRSYLTRKYVVHADDRQKSMGLSCITAETNDLVREVWYLINLVVEHMGDDEMGEIAHVEKPVCDYAAKRGFIVRKCSWIGRRGAPDRLFMGHGRFFFVEFKDTGEVPEPHQEREINRMLDNGIPVHVIDSFVDGCDLIDRELACGRSAGGPRADREPRRSLPPRPLYVPDASHDPAADFF